MAASSIALPGQILGPASAYTPGPGTHLHNTQICASIAGTVSHPPPATPQTNGTSNPPAPLPTISIARPPPSAAASATANATTTLPTVGSTVLARVTRLTPRRASVTILVVDDISVSDPFTASSSSSSGFPALIRQTDIRATEKDKVRVIDSFRVGDIVRATVISLGDQQNYYLSTAENRLGVLVAWSEDGNLCRAVSWREMRDPVTGRGEARKVARPV